MSGYSKTVNFDVFSLFYKKKHKDWELQYEHVPDISPCLHYQYSSSVWVKAFRAMTLLRVGKKIRKQKKGLQNVFATCYRGTRWDERLFRHLGNEPYWDCDIGGNDIRFLDSFLNPPLLFLSFLNLFSFKLVCGIICTIRWSLLKWLLWTTDLNCFFYYSIKLREYKHETINLIFLKPSFEQCTGRVAGTILCKTTLKEDQAT